jgi:hypothetical protein
MEDMSCNLTVCAFEFPEVMEDGAVIHPLRIWIEHGPEKMRALDIEWAHGNGYPTYTNRTDRPIHKFPLTSEVVQFRNCAITEMMVLINGNAAALYIAPDQPDVLKAAKEAGRQQAFTLIESFTSTDENVPTDGLILVRRHGQPIISSAENPLLTLLAH